MFVKINGKNEEIKGPISILDLLKDKRINQDAIAIEYNLEIIPREKWAQLALKTGDSIEIVRFMGGGS